MKYEITNAKADIRFATEIATVHDDGESIAVLGADLSKACGWKWRPALEQEKFYKAVTATGFDVVFTLREGRAATLFADGSYDENLSLDSLTEIEPL